MNYDFFGIQIDRLKHVYGEKNYPDERTKQFYAILKAFSNEWMKSTVDALIANCRYSPLMEDFQPYINKALDEINNSRRAERDANQENHVIQCFECNDLAIVFANRRTDQSLFAFRCECEIGLNDKRIKIPLWGDRWVRDYEKQDINKFKPAHAYKKQGEMSF